jgi:predicted dehydrogenase
MENKFFRSMSMTNIPIKVGLQGFGFIGKVHAQAYQSVPFAYPHPTTTAKINAIMRINTEGDKKFIQSLGSPVVTADNETFYQQDLDLIDICTPNIFHKNQTLEAIAHKKHVYLEKPLGMNIAQAREIAEAARNSGVLTHTAFMMRFYPAVQQAKAIITSGALGEIYHFRAHYFHNSYMDPNRPISWRLQHATSGGGALADLGVHIIDMTRYLMGEANSVSCRTRTFINQRPESTGSNKLVPVDVDDWALCTIELESGGQGLIEVTRLSGGMGDSARMEIFGKLGSVIIDLSDPSHCIYFDQNKKVFHSGSLDFPTPVNEIPQTKCWPSAKMSLGYFLNAHTASVCYFLGCIHDKRQSSVNFEDALKTQEILEAAYRSADSNSETIRLPLSRQ